jgi:hypothetical protein
LLYVQVRFGHIEPVMTVHIRLHLHVCGRQLAPNNQHAEWRIHTQMYIYIYIYIYAYSHTYMTALARMRAAAVTQESTRSKAHTYTNVYIYIYIYIYIHTYTTVHAGMRTAARNPRIDTRAGRCRARGGLAAQDSSHLTRQRPDHRSAAALRVFDVISPVFFTQGSRFACITHDAERQDAAQGHLLLNLSYIHVHRFIYIYIYVAIIL